MAAAETGREELVKLLLEKGADIDFKTESGETALTLAEKNGFNNIIDLIRRFGG
jgi:ankyrin repeat protein